MKLRNFIILGLFMSIILSACSKKEEVAPASLVGKWTLQAFGSKTNIKSYEVTLSQVQSLTSQDTIFNYYADVLSTITYEFKDENNVKSYTANTVFVEGDKGTWQLSSDNKTLTLTSSVLRYPNGTYYTEALEVQDLTANSVKLALPTTYNINDAEPTAEPSYTYYYFSYLPVYVGASNLDFAQTTTFRGYYALKR